MGIDCPKCGKRVASFEEAASGCPQCGAQLLVDAESGHRPGIPTWALWVTLLFGPGVANVVLLIHGDHYARHVGTELFSVVLFDLLLIVMLTMRARTLSARILTFTGALFAAAVFDAGLGFAGCSMFPPSMY